MSVAAGQKQVRLYGTDMVKTKNVNPNDQVFLLSVCLVVWLRPFASSITRLRGSHKLLSLKPLDRQGKKVLSFTFSGWSRVPSSHIDAPTITPTVSLSSAPSRRHGKGRISRQSRAVQTQLYDRKSPQP